MKSSLVDMSVSSDLDVLTMKPMKIRHENTLSSVASVQGSPIGNLESLK